MRMIFVPTASSGARLEPRRRRLRSDARDHRTDVTDPIPPGGPAGAPTELDTANPTAGEDRLLIPSTLDLEPGMDGPLVAETLASLSASADGTLDMSSA